MSQQLATLTVKNNGNPPPKKKLLTWIKASKEDHSVVEKTQARKFKSKSVLSLCTCSNHLWASAARTDSIVTVGQGLPDHLGPVPFWYVLSTKKCRGRFLRIARLWLSTLLTTKSNHLLLTFLFSFILNQLWNPLLTKASRSPINTSESLRKLKK